MGAKISQWVKANLTVVICGTLAVLSIAALAWGIFMSDLQTTFAADSSVYSNLQTATGKPVNEKAIEEARRAQSDVRRNVQRFLNEAAKTNARTVLHNAVFPEVKEQFDRKDFKTRYEQRRKELLGPQLLNAGDKPDTATIAEYRRRLDRAAQKKRQQEGTGGAAPNAAPGGFNAPGPATPLPRSPAMDGGEIPGAMKSSLGAIPEGMSLEEWIKVDEGAGAALERAHGIFCYANLDALDPRSQLTENFPSVENMWFAQVSIWVQEDILGVLARMNNEAAAQVSDKENRWVGVLPIKHLLYLSISDYLPKSAGGSEPGSVRPAAPAAQPQGPGSTSEVLNNAAPPGSVGQAFTNRGSQENIDVMHVALGLVIDASQLLKVLDEVGKTGFYTPLNVIYESVEDNPNLRDYIYGSSPTIRVRILLECCIRRNMEVTVGDKKVKYEELMPATIKSGTHIRQAGPGASPAASPWGVGGMGGGNKPY